MQSLKQLEETLNFLIKKRKNIVANDYGMTPIESQPQAEKEKDDEEECDEMDKVWEKIGRIKEDIEYLKDYVKEVSNHLYRHKEGHIPSIESPSKMEKVLEILEISEDFEVMKKPVYAFVSQAGQKTMIISRFES